MIVGRLVDRGIHGTFWELVPIVGNQILFFKADQKLDCWKGGTVVALGMGCPIEFSYDKSPKKTNVTTN